MGKQLVILSVVALWIWSLKMRWFLLVTPFYSLYNVSVFDFSEAKLNDIPVVVLDTEATGLYPGLGDRLVEIGAVRYEGGRRVGEMTQLINPGRPMSKQAADVVGIYDKDLVGQPTFAEVAKRVLHFIDGALLVAHNASFDANFLGLEFAINAPKNYPIRQPVLPNPWLCTLLLARRHFHFEHNNLSLVAKQLGAPVGRSHRALSDVYTTAEVLKRMVRELSRGQQFKTVGDLLYAQGGAIYTPPPLEIELLEPLATAVLEKRPLLILYIGEQGESWQTVIPSYVTDHRGIIHLVTHGYPQNDQRIFRLDRIFHAELQK